MKKCLFLLVILFIKPFLSHSDDWKQRADYGGSSTGFAVGFAINGKGYIGTGGPGFSKTFWEYDATTNAWAQKADFAGDGRVYAIGFSIGNKGYIGLGKINDNMPSDDFWEYDPYANTWIQKANFPGGIRWNAFSFTLNAKGYVGAGQAKGSWKQDFWEYDPITNLWTQKANYGGGKVGGAFAFTIDNKAYVGTGRDINLDYRNDFWEYDPATDTWTQKMNFDGGERTGAVSFSIGSWGFIGLGATQDSTFADFWKYDLISDTWEKKSDFPGIASSAAVGFSIGSFGYVGTGGNSKQFYQYTPDCSIPIDLTTTNIKSTSAKVNWSVVPGAQTYSVRYRKTGTIAWTKVTTQLNLKKLTGLSPNKEYEWSVKSVCDAANNISSDWSASQNFTTKPLRLENESEEEISVDVYPNPFSSSTVISFSLLEISNFTAEFFDMAGHKVEILLDGNLEAGDHKVSLNREHLPAGVYFLRIKLNEQSSIMKVVIL